jgi:hypothetical protein
MKRTSDNPNTSQTLLLQSLDLLEQRLDLVELLTCQRKRLPPIIDYRTSIRVDSKRGIHIPSIKLLGIPFLNRINQVIVKELPFPTLAKLDSTTTQDRSTITTGVWFQAKEVAKQEDRGEDSKKGLTKVNEHRETENYVRGQVVQRNIKILKKSMKKGRRWEVESTADEGDEENNPTRTRGNPVLTRGLPLSEALVLDQPVIGQLPQLIFSGDHIGPDLLCSPHGDELLVLDYLKHWDLLRLARRRLFLPIH